MRTQAFPPPYRGQRDDIPLAALEAPFAQYVTNFNLDTGVPTLRNGDSVWFRDGTKSTQYYYDLSTYGTGSSTLLLGLRYNTVSAAHEFYDLSTINVATLVRSLAGASGTSVQTLFFNNYLFYFGQGVLGTTPQYYNGTAWGNSGYTFPTITPWGGESFKNRAYIIGYQSAKYAYSGVDLISGACAEVDLSSLVSQKAYLYGIKSISLSQGIQQENVLAFIFNTGEVLVFSGTYPGGSWSIVGKFLMPEVLGYNSFVAARGDSFVITKANLVSLRTLFTQGVDIALEQGISAPIANRWKYVVNYTTIVTAADSIRGGYDPVNNRLVIFFPVNLASANQYLMFCYSFKTQSWWEVIGGSLVGP